ncbi:uncharacterized protein N7529_007221 [Penicillium soppii]|uniref:uncharacterized protein n=1 Tax=Penicillium soppii TaxID=69789 RepID=UPI002546D0A2|nr:uncharacterized protein N7529_007221 [Penicillium soppii]KAJ5865305.1 hypothetical protein N7529_007221 [Penicillium soppii]
MSEADSQRPAKGKEPLFERIFEHHHHHNEEEECHADKKNGVSNNKDKPKSYKDYLEKDEKALKDYYEKDKELEAEGQTYGGLM